jgi:signal peptidase I
MKRAGREPSSWYAERRLSEPEIHPRCAKDVPKKRGRRRQEPRETPVEFFASLAELLVIVLFIMTFVLQNFEIPSSSMEDTLLIGDHVFVNREQFAPPTRWMGPLLPYRDIRRDDIAVFLSPEQPGLFLVKRIIGVPGDRIHLRDDACIATAKTGRTLRPPQAGAQSLHAIIFLPYPPSEMYGVRNEKWAQELPSHIEGDDIVVPPDSYFAMGDNRDVSYDSRFWGFIPRKNVIGRPMFIYWSFITPPNQYLMRSAATASIRVHGAHHHSLLR